MVSTDPRTAVVGAEPAPARSGAQSGALLAAASAVSIVLNYAFLLAAGRVLGSAGYGSLAALLGLLAVVLIPAATAQMAVSREISRRIASGDEAGARAFARASLRYALLATAPLVVIALALAVPLAHLLHIHSVAVVVLAELTFATAFLFPVAQGIIQGFQRFHALAALYVAPFVIRLPVFGVAAAAGARLGGAIFATLLGTVAATAFALAAVRDTVAGGEERTPRAELAAFGRYLTPVAAGLIGIALLTHLDILIVKARLSADDAGAYGAASAFARVGFFLPATILSVLFPRTAARQARGEQTEDILGRSLLATAGFCALLALFYAATGRGLVAMTFGSDFAHGGAVLAPFALAIGMYSLAYILVGYHLSRGETRYAWIVGGAVAVQLATLALVPGSLRSIVWANLVVAAALVIAHEVFVGSSASAVRKGIRRLVVVTPSSRVALRELGIVLLGTTVFVCALFWPVVVHFGSTIIGAPGSDSTGSVSSFWLMHHEGGYHILGTTHHTFSGAPFGWDQTNAINLQLVLAYYPTYLASIVIGPVAAYNLITLAGYVLSGTSMYFLVRYLGCTRLVAAWAALAFIVFPFHIVHEEHASLLHLECLVFVLFALIAAARRPTWPRLVLVGVANLTAWLISGYFGPMAFITTIAFAAGVALVEKNRRSLRLVIGAAAAAGVAAGVMAIATVASGENASLGLERLPQDLSSLAIHPFDLVVPPVGNIVVGDHLTSFWARHMHGSLPAEASNYLGLLTLALAVAWVVGAYRRRDSNLRAGTAGLVASFVVGLLFALPSPLLGHKMPSRLLWHFISAFHVPSRWDFLLMTALVPLAALALERIRGAAGRRNAWFGVTLVGVAMVVSFFELTVHPARPRWRTVPAPAEYKALDQTPDGIVAEYPLGYSDLYRIWQRVHGRPLVNGAPQGTTADQIHLSLLDPAEPGTASALSLLGVTAIVLHPGGHADVPVAPREPTGVDGYRLVGRYPDQSSVWDVVAPPAPALVTYSGGFAPPRRDGNGPIEATLVASTANLELRAKAPALIRVRFVVTNENGGSATFRISDGAREVAVPVNGTAPVAVAVEAPRGFSTLAVKADAPAVVDVTQPQAETANGTALLHAQLVSPSPGF